MLYINYILVSRALLPLYPCMQLINVIAQQTGADSCAAFGSTTISHIFTTTY